MQTMIIEKINDTYQVDVNLRFYETSSQEDERLQWRERVQMSQCSQILPAG